MSEQKLALVNLQTDSATLSHWDARWRANEGLQAKGLQRITRRVTLLLSALDPFTQPEISSRKVLDAISKLVFERRLITEEQRIYNDPFNIYAEKTGILIRRFNEIARKWNTYMEGRKLKLFSPVDGADELYDRLVEIRGYVVHQLKYADFLLTHKDEFAANETVSFDALIEGLAQARDSFELVKVAMETEGRGNPLEGRVGELARIQAVEEELRAIDLSPRADLKSHQERPKLSLVQKDGDST